MCLSSCPSGPPTADNRAPSLAPPAPPHVRRQTHLNRMQTCRMPRGLLSTFILKLTRSMWACVSQARLRMSVPVTMPLTAPSPPSPPLAPPPPAPPRGPSGLTMTVRPHTRRPSRAMQALPAPSDSQAYQDTLRSVPGSTHLARRSLVSCLSLTLSPFSCSSANKQRVSVSAPPRPTWLTHDPKPPGASPSKVRDTCTGYACARPCL